MHSKEFEEEIKSGQGRLLKKLIPLVDPARNGKPRSFVCLWRWATHGVKDRNGKTIHLETIKMPNGLTSTPGALYRFFRAQTPSKSKEVGCA